ncbi:MAG: tRNA lysidine(34) synthetase TilS [Candidatus Dormibacteria bacterium]
MGGDHPLPPADRVRPVARVRRAVARALDRDGILEPGETVLVACSGGPDSMTLLDALVRLAPPRELRLVVAHVDHGLRRGSAAEADLPAAMAAAAGLPFHALSATVAGRGSPQDLARRARHTALSTCAAALGAQAIALGHTADDQAETVLMRVLRGADPRGLPAMRGRERGLARPLLRVWRADIEEYCLARRMTFICDPSNSDRRYLRTRVRHELLPALEAVFPGARRRLLVLADRQRALMEGLVNDLPTEERRPPR